MPTHREEAEDKQRTEDHLARVTARADEAAERVRTLEQELGTLRTLTRNLMNRLKQDGISTAFGISQHYAALAKLLNYP